jgi:hypothetical protein
MGLKDTRHPEFKFKCLENRCFQNLKVTSASGAIWSFSA